MVEFGLDTFMPVTDDGQGQAVRGDQVVRNIIEEAVLAEAVGIDSFNIGEHYRPEYMDSANHVVLAAIAGRTERIRLGTAVTVLSTQDPVRVYTDFATLDAVSNGRAQLIVGRGSATESFPLFGFDLADYEELFEEKLDLFAALLRSDTVTWPGSGGARWGGATGAIVRNTVFAGLQRRALIVAVRGWITAQPIRPPRSRP